jgi:hypothetical protein
MNLLRVLVIFVAVTLSGGAFGAVVGGLMGVALPNTVSFFYETDKEIDEGASDAEATKSRREAAVGVGQHEDSSLAPGWRGAAFGGAFGLILGAILGLPIALADQFLTAGAGLLLKRQMERERPL